MRNILHILSAVGT